jgi:lysylphosphatidylglycerol synthetase-like protein (DUF2156 family)
MPYGPFYSFLTCWAASLVISVFALVFAAKRRLSVVRAYGVVLITIGALLFVVAFTRYPLHRRLAFSRDEMLDWMVPMGLGAFWVLLSFKLKTKESVFPYCTSCGYNLTGNVSGICPECGTPVAASK